MKKTISVSEEIYEFLNKKQNASSYITELILKDQRGESNINGIEEIKKMLEQLLNREQIINVYNNISPNANAQTSIQPKVDVEKEEKPKKKSIFMAEAMNMINS